MRYSQPNLDPILRGSNTVAAVLSVLNPRRWHKRGALKFGRTTITNVVFAVAIRRRWRTVPRYRTSDGIRIPRQIGRSLPSDLSRLAARDAAIRSRK